MRTANPTHAIPQGQGIFAAAVAHAFAPRRPAGEKRPAPRPGLLERFDRAVARARQRDLERYLAGSKDVFELEQRIRNLERTRYF